MNKKLLNLVIMFIILALTYLTGCVSNQTNKDTTLNVNYPLFPKVEITSYKNDTIWNIMNVSSNLNKTFYVTNSNISDIIDWYETKENIGKYELLNGGSSGISLTDIDPYNISYGYVKMHTNNKTQGLFVFVIKTLDTMGLEKENLMGVVTGSWELIDSCKKTGNFTSLR